MTFLARLRWSLRAFLRSRDGSTPERPRKDGSYGWPTTPRLSTLALIRRSHPSVDSPTYRALKRISGDGPAESGPAAIPGDPAVPAPRKLDPIGHRAFQSRLRGTPTVATSTCPTPLKTTRPSPSASPIWRTDMTCDNANDHRFAKFDDATIFCQRCGEQRVMDVHALIAKLPVPTYLPCPGPHYPSWRPGTWWSSPTITYTSGTISTAPIGDIS